MTPHIKDLALPTLKHLREADADLVEDIQTMGRWQERRQRPNPGGAMRAKEISWRPMSHLKEDISVEIENGTGTYIKVIHTLSNGAYLAAGKILHVTLDGPIPETVRNGLEGGKLKRLIDLAGTSLEDLNEATITSFMRRGHDMGDNRWIAYLDNRVVAMSVGTDYGTVVKGSALI